MSKQALYSKVSVYTPEIVDRLVELTKSTNQNVALGACKALLNKSIPDLRALKVFEDDKNKQRSVIYLPRKNLLGSSPTV